MSTWTDDHNDPIPSQPPVENSDVTAALTYVRAVQQMLRQDRRRGMASLTGLFGDGEMPTVALHGRYRGQILAFDIAPGLTKATATFYAHWPFWLGKTFNAPQQSGDDIYLRTLLRRARLFWPGYRGYVADTAQTYRAFPFRTHVAASILQPAQQIMRLDYDLPGNPRLSVARTMDEVVQLAGDVYLGRAFVHWWWGRWQPVAYFVLRSTPDPVQDE
ncbi:MAG: hypothetical protein R3C14_53340 [Caldilineaceae bacterium]